MKWDSVGMNECLARIHRLSQDDFCVLVEILGEHSGKGFQQVMIENLWIPCCMRDNQSAKDSNGAVHCKMALCSYSIPESLVKNSP